MRNVFPLLLCLFTIVQGAVSTQEQLRYQPYPVVLVHGFSQLPVEPYGLPTYKKVTELKSNGKPKEKDIRGLSTQIDTSLYLFDQDRIGYTLINAFDAEEGGTDYWSYRPEQDTTGINSYAYDYFKNIKYHRFYPWEDKGDNHNYTGINHSFVELYCNHYQFESDDGGDVLGSAGDAVEEPTFSAYSNDEKDSVGYDIMAGGQTQILRIRIIQMLNEYYGDFKWLNDPSAKVNIVSYSNGGTISTWLVKNDENWYNDGRNGHGIPLSEFVDGTSNGDPEQAIDGFGVRLRDHINQVITINSPFKGTPWSYSEHDGTSPAKRGMAVSLASLAGGITVTSFLATNPVVQIAHQANVAIPGVFLTSNAALIAQFSAWGAGLGGIGGGIIFDGIYQAGWDGKTALAYDVHPESNFAKKLQGDGVQPLYSNGEVIPFTNVVGVQKNMATIFNLAGAVSATMGVATLIPPSPTYCPQASPALFGTSVPLFIVGKWFSHSDFIISEESQQMSNIYKDADVRVIRKEKRLFDGKESTMHVKIIKNVAPEVPEMLDRWAPEAMFTHVIGNKQFSYLQSLDSDLESANQLPTLPVENDTSSSTAPFKSGVEFPYMSQDTVVSKRWAAVDNGEVVTSATTGRAQYLVGKLSDYYMNRTTVECKVNIGEWDTLNFYTDTGSGEFGNYSSMYVDMNNDGHIDDYDGKLDGALFFAKVNPMEFHMGTNLVRLRVTNQFGEEIIEKVNVLHSIERAVAFEADESGAKTQNNLLYQAVRWDDTTSKKLTFGFTSMVDSSQGGCSFYIDHDDNTEEIPFTLFEPENPVPDYNSNFLMSVELDYEDLRKDSTGAPELEQTVLLNTRVQLENGQPATETKMFFPFVVDNVAPSISLTEPRLRFDFNNDGRLTSADDINNDSFINGLDLDYLTNSDSAIAEFFSNPAFDTLPEGLLPDRYLTSEYDGIDNDGDGVWDDNDYSEWKDIEVRSVSRDWNGTLFGDPLYITFSLNDNAASVAGLGRRVVKSVYRDGESTPIWSDTTDSPQLGSNYSSSWKFTTTNGENITDGLYYLLISAEDRAGNVGLSDTAWFIVDNTPPTGIDLVREWGDNSGNKYINQNSEWFGFYWRPNSAADEYDTEAEELRIKFKPINRAGDLLDADAYEFLSTAMSDDRFGETTPDVPTLGADGIIDATRFIILSDTSFAANTLPDGRYVTEVVAIDRAGNSRIITELTGETVIVDRTPPIVYEQHASPVLLLDSLRELDIALKISESHDHIDNRLDNNSESFIVRYTIDNGAAVTDIVTPSNGEITEWEKSLGLYSTLWESNPKLKEPGRHKVVVDVFDALDNRASAKITFFYENDGVYIASPEEGDTVAGIVVIEGNIDDIRLNNSNGFERYELRVTNASGTEVPSVITVPNGGTVSNETVRLNGVIGLFNTTTLSAGNYTIHVDIYESGIDEPTTITRTIHIPDSSDTTIVIEQSTPSIEAGNIPVLLADTNATYEYSYTLTDAVADVRTRIVENMTGREVFNAAHAGVVPLNGAPTDTLSLVKIGKVPNGLTVTVSDLAKIELTFSETIDSSLAVSNSEGIVAVDGSTVTITSIQYGVPCEVTIPYGENTPISVSVSGVGVTAERVAIGAANIRPQSTTFTLNTSSVFNWNGRTPEGSYVSNGHYTVYVNATGVNGNGFDRIEPVTLNITAQPDLEIWRDTNSLAPEYSEGEIAALRFKVNKQCNIAAAVIITNGVDDEIIATDTMWNISVGSSGSASYEWDGAVDSAGTLVNSQNMPYFRMIAFNNYNEVDTLLVPVKVTDPFAVTSDGLDPFTVLGGKKGTVASLSDSSKEYQVVSGNSDVLVKAQFHGEHYQDIPVAIKANVKRRYDFTINTDVTFTSKIKIRGLVEVWRNGSLSHEYDRGAGDSKTKSWLYHPDNPVGNIWLNADNSSGWKSWTFSSDRREYRGDGMQSTSETYHFRNKMGTMQFDGSSHSNKFKPLDLLDEFGDDSVYALGTYIFTSALDNDVDDDWAKIGAFRGGKELSYTTLDWSSFPPTQVEHVEADYVYCLSSVTLNCEKAALSGSTHLSYNPHGVFYKDYPFLQRSRPVDDVDADGDPIEQDLTLPWGTPEAKDWKTRRYISNQFYDYDDVVYDAYDATNDTTYRISHGDFFKNDFYRNVRKGNNADTDWTNRLGTYSYYGTKPSVDSIFRDGSDSRQIWLEIKPTLTFKGDNTRLVLNSKTARADDEDGAPRKREYVGSGGFRQTDENYEYSWILGGSNSEIDESASSASLVAQFNSADACTLYATTNDRGELMYSVVGPEIDSLKPGILETEELDTLNYENFRLVRSGHYIGYGDPTVSIEDDKIGDSVLTYHHDLSNSVNGEDFISLEATAMIHDSSGQWVEAPEGLFTLTQTSDTEIEIEVDEEKARQLNYITTWSSMQDKQLTNGVREFSLSDSLFADLSTPFGNASVESSTGSLLFRVASPEKIDFWSETEFKAPYSMVFDSAVSDEYDLFIGADGATNPRIILEEVDLSLFNVDEKFNYQISKNVNIDAADYEKSKVRLSLKWYADNKAVSAVKLRINQQPGREFFAVIAHQYGRVDTIVSETSNSSAEWQGRHFCWNSFSWGGPVDLRLSYYDRDSSGNIDEESRVTYNQKYYSGFLVGDSVYSDTTDNYTAHSGYRRAELIYDDEHVTDNVFDDVVVSSVFPVDLSEAVITGVKPVTSFSSGTVRSLSGRSPIISATPSPVTFRDGNRPTLYYRFTRDEVHTMSITKDDMVKVYHVNSRNGALSDISSGVATAYSNNGDEIFTEDATDFNDRLDGTDWDYLELMAAPAQFSHLVPLVETKTILDRIELTHGIKGRPEAMAVEGKVILNTGDNLNPDAKYMNVVLDYRQNLPDSDIRSAESALRSSAHSHLYWHVSESEFFVKLDSILPETLGDMDTISVYAWCSQDTIPGGLNAPVSFTQFIISTENDGYKATTENHYISENKTESEWTIATRESGTLRITQYTTAGEVESVKEYAVGAGDEITHTMNLFLSGGVKRNEGYYPFSVVLTDAEGNHFLDTTNYQFIVDLTVPNVVNPKAFLDTATLGIAFQTVVQDNYDLDSVTVIAGDSVDSRAVYTTLDSVSALYPLPNRNGTTLELSVELVDKAMNRNTISVPFSFMPDEKYHEDWGKNQQVEIALPDSLNITDTLYDYPLLLTLNSKNFTFTGGNQKQSFRITDRDACLLPFEIDSWNSSEASIWVRVPVITPQTNTIALNIFWENDSAVDISWLAPLTWNNCYKAVYHMNTIKASPVNENDTAIGDHFVVPDYGLYATGTLTITHRSDVRDGSAGANTGVEFLVDVDAGQGVIVEGDVVSSELVSIMRFDSIMGDVISGGAVTGEVQYAYVAGEIKTQTVVPEFAIPSKEIETTTGQPFTVGQSEIDTLYPGVYSTISLFHIGELHIMPGRIVCDSFMMIGHDAKIVYHLNSANDVIDINVRKLLSYGGRRINSRIEGIDAPERIRYYSNQTELFHAEYNNHLIGVFTLPYADVRFDQQDTLDGALYANNIWLGWHTTVNTSAKRLVEIVERFDDATRFDKDGINYGAGLTKGSIGNCFFYRDDSASSVIPVLLESTEYSITGIFRSGNSSAASFTLGQNRVEITMAIDTGWHSFALVVSENDTAFYLDGTELNSTAFEVIPASSTESAIGYATSGTFELDEVRFIEGALSESWITLNSVYQQNGDEFTAFEPLNAPTVSALFNSSEQAIQLVFSGMDEDSLEISRRSETSGTWIIIQPYAINDSVFCDYSTYCDEIYEYRARILSGVNMKSPWSETAEVKVPNCDRFEYYKLVMPALDETLAPITTEELQIRLALYSKYNGGSELWSTTDIVNNRAGWLEYTLHITKGLRTELTGNAILYWEIAINGVTQGERVPVASKYNALTNPYRISGENSPVGRKNADLGTIYVDTVNNKLYFKFGASAHDWKKID